MVAYASSNDVKQQYDVHSLQKSSRITKKQSASNISRQPKPKVYKVKPIHFRELVQQLTGTQQPARSTLQSVAPPPITLNPNLQFPNSTQTTVEIKPALCKVEKDLISTQDIREGWEGMTELNMSPNFQSWFNFAMLSPGTATRHHI